MYAVSSHEQRASVSGADVDEVLGGLRRLRLLADTAQDGETIFAGLARELIATLGAEEVHVHHLVSVRGQDLVAVYVLGGDGRLSYLQPREERPPGVSWVAGSGRSFLAVGPRELDAAVPRVALTSPPQPGTVACALLVPLTMAGQVESVVVLVRREGEPFGERSIEQAGALVGQAATALALVHARAEAGTDPVAGCMNHRGMRRRLLEEIGRARRSRTPLSCLMIDLDNFKLVNDRHGHHTGDAMLREVAHALMGEFRAFDRVARYGGDEFVVILPHADIDAAAAAGARALGRLKAIQLAGGGRGDGEAAGMGGETVGVAGTPDGVAQAGGEVSGVAGVVRGVSASIGAAQWREPMGVDELLEACDAALLQRKRHGKSGVTRANGSPTMAVHA